MGLLRLLKNTSRSLLGEKSKPEALGFYVEHQLQLRGQKLHRLGVLYLLRPVVLALHPPESSEPERVV